MEEVIQSINQSIFPWMHQWVNQTINRQLQESKTATQAIECLRTQKHFPSRKKSNQWSFYLLFEASTEFMQILPTERHIQLQSLQSIAQSHENRLLLPGDSAHDGRHRNRRSICHVARSSRHFSTSTPQRIFRRCAIFRTSFLLLRQWNGMPWQIKRMLLSLHHFRRFVVGGRIFYPTISIFHRGFRHLFNGGHIFW